MPINNNYSEEAIVEAIAIALDNFYTKNKVCLYSSCIAETRYPCNSGGSA